MHKTSKRKNGFHPRSKLRGFCRIFNKYEYLFLFYYIPSSFSKKRAINALYRERFHPRIRLQVTAVVNS